MLARPLFAALLAAPGALSATYSVSESFIGSSFLTGFDHIAISDPTHGRVKYVATLRRRNQG